MRHFDYRSPAILPPSPFTPLVRSESAQSSISQRMISSRNLSIMFFAFLVIDFVVFLFIGVIFFPPPADKECNPEAVPNLTTVEQVECTFDYIKTSFTNVLFPFKLCHLPIHCFSFFIVDLLTLVIYKCERDYSRPVQRKRKNFRRFIARYDVRNSVLITKLSALIHK